MRNAVEVNRSIKFEKSKVIAVILWVVIVWMDKNLCKRDENYYRPWISVMLPKFHRDAEYISFFIIRHTMSSSEHSLITNHRATTIFISELS